jgi:hypothetical protein
MLARHIFASAGKGLELCSGIRMTFGYNITAEDNTVIRRGAVLDDRQPLTLRGEVTAK